MFSRHKKGISIFLVMLMLLGGWNGLFGGNKVYAEDTIDFADGSGTFNDPYQIANADQFDNVRNLPNWNINYYKLVSDIDLSGLSNWEPFTFTGILEGNGFKIINLTINKPTMDSVGLFSNNSGTLRNIILENISVRGQNQTGGLVGANYGTISSSSVTGIVYGNNDTGGLAGYNNQYAPISGSYAAGSVTGADNTGGLVGNNGGQIKWSYATGSVTGAGNSGGLVGRNIGPIISSYATGSVTGVDNLGGLVGWSGSSISDDSFYDSEISGQSDTGKGVGKSTSEMKTKTTFTSWDFNSNWYMLPDQYPQLWAFISLSQGTVTGTTYLNHGAAGMEYKINTGSYTAVTGASIDNIPVVIGDEISVRITADPSSARILTVDSTNIKPASAPTAVLTAGSDVTGTTQLTGVTDAMEYKVNSGSYMAITGTSVDSIAVDEGDRIYVRVRVTATQPASVVQILNVGLENIKIGPLVPAIAGITAPVEFATPSLSIAANPQYTASVVWSPAHETFAGGVSYTAAITLTPKSGYSFSNVPANFFTVNGATATNPAHSGVVTAVFPAFPSSFAGGTGRMNDPYQIATAAQLDKVRLSLGSYFKLTADIDLSSYQTGTGWEPIGNGSGSFRGHMDGNGHTITGLTIDRPDTNRVGLFGYLSNNASLTDLKLENVSVTGEDDVGGLVGYLEDGTVISSYAAGTVTGNGNGIGGLIGIMEDGTISDSHTSVNVSGSGENTGGLLGNGYGTISNSYASGSVTGDNRAGGLVGYNEATINNSYASGTVSGIRPVGGLTGYNSGIISNSHATGNVSGSSAATGGLVGTNQGEIRSSYATGNVIGTGEETGDRNSYSTGGLVGINFDEISDSYAIGNVSQSVDYITAYYNVGGLVGYNNHGSVSNSYATGSVTRTVSEGGTWLLGGLVGDNNGAVGRSFYDQETTGQSDTGKGIPALTENMIRQSLYSGADWNLSGIWGIDSSRNNGYPYLYALPSAAIMRVTAPVSGATPVSSIATEEYTASIAWTPADATFVEGVSYTAAITLTPKTGYTLTGVTENFFTVAGATTTTNAVNAGVVTAVFPETIALPPSSIPSAPPSAVPTTPPIDTPVIATDGKLTLQAGKMGEVSLGDEVKIAIPADASGKELKITIDKVPDAQNLLTDKEVLVSLVYEILKNFPENFNKPVTLTFTFDPTILKDNQRAAVFYYDEEKKVWVEVGGMVIGGKITVDVNHFTKYAVLAVDTNPEVNFSDISGHWAESSIKKAVSGGIVKGYLDGTFKPNQTVTRAEFAVMLMSALKPIDEGTVLTFTDAEKIGTWAQKAVAQAVQAGIVKGYADGSFRPDTTITRAEMAAMVANALKLPAGSNPDSGFADDKKIPSWAKSSVAALKNLGVISGKGKLGFDPSGRTSRAEAVTVLLKMLEQKSK